MRILFIAQASLKKELGGPKVVLELAEALTELGHDTTVVGPQEIETYLKANSLSIDEEFATNIKNYLNEILDYYDVIDVDANHLYKFKISSEISTLVVARSVLFIPHLQYITWPNSFKNNLKNVITKIIKGKSQKKTLISSFYKSINNADLINVSNHKDVDLLLKKGYDSSKFLNLPYGLTLQKRENLNSIANYKKTKNNILFLGTFDYRKGCLDTPKIFMEIKKNIPDANLTLIGSKGEIQNTQDMFNMFPKKVHSSITIIPTFAAEDLPNLLREFKIAIFPSYLEGFAFSVIESMAAGIPVIAYKSPGPSSILRNDYLVEPGDWKSMAQKIIHYTTNETDYKQAINDMLQDCKKYDWSIIAKDTFIAYNNALLAKASDRIN